MPQDISHDVYVADGSFDFCGGVDSSKVTTVQSALTPNGLPRNTLAWLVNGTVRDGGIYPRNGWKYLGQVTDADGLYQGGFMYNPIDDSRPYLILSISGHIYKIDLDETFGVIDLSSSSPLQNPPTEPYGYFEQAEEFLVIQAGDGTTLPLFWDGATLRRSNGSQVTEDPIPNTITVQNISANGLVGTVQQYGWGSYTLPDGNPLIIQQQDDLNYITIPAIGGTFNIEVTQPYDGPVASIYFNPWSFLGSIAQGYFQITAATNYGASPAELPAAKSMVYYYGRLWYAQGQQYCAGDIVGGPSGSADYGLRDAVIRVTENPVAIGGDAFSLPSTAGTIRALTYNANLNSTLGQGKLIIGTRKSVFALEADVNRETWIGTTAANPPSQTIMQINNGPVNDRSVVHVNGDLYYQSLEPGIRSLITAVRYFEQPGNRPISDNVDRILRYNDRSLLKYATGTFWGNRLLQSALPRQTMQGVVHDALMPLDFMPVSSFGASFNPVWEGHHEGLSMLQVFTGDFGGRERTFAIVSSNIDGAIEVWELTDYLKTDVNREPAGTNNANEVRITMSPEFPAFTWGKEFELKELHGGRLWVDQIWGTVDLDFYYRPDSDPCWHFWHSERVCAARDCAEDPRLSCESTYPLQPYREGYAWALTLPRPKYECSKIIRRQSTIAYQFQVKVVVKGWLRIRGIMLYGEFKGSGIYSDLRC